MRTQAFNRVAALLLGTALCSGAAADTEVVYRQEIVGGSRILVPRAVEAYIEAQGLFRQ